jgi:hypothetical protein
MSPNPPTLIPLRADPIPPPSRFTVLLISLRPLLIPETKPPPKSPVNSPPPMPLVTPLATLVTELIALLAELKSEENGLSERGMRNIPFSLFILDKMCYYISNGEPYNYDNHIATT